MMRVPLLLLLLVGASCTRPVSGQALLVTVEFAQASRSRCAIVSVVESSKTTAAMVGGERTSLEVAIYRDELPETVTLEARGFSDEGCTQPIERSSMTTATFGPTLTRVSLELDGEVNGDGGFQPDAGLPDAGPDDAGVDAGEEDAGEDAGFDAGVELCSNRADDDGDGLMDCADPGCADGVSCDDGDLCTTGEQCAGQLCTNQMTSCAGPVASCMVPAGCDAGVCLALPAPAFQSCDGGRCDGAGRCAPFCDPTRPAPACASVTSSKAR